MANPTGGNAQSAGQQPTLTFARANDRDPVRPATFKQITPVAPTRYCRKCYIALPTAARDKCTNCGAPLKRT